jgi:histidinol-phosphatase (PHP family)
MHAWANYHSHNNYCDGSEEPVKYAEEAVRLGLAAYGFSSHAPVGFETNWCLSDFELERYLKVIKNIKEQYNSRIQIYLGLEVDFIPGFAGRSKHLVKNTQLDYFIGSVHFVDQFADGTCWNIDTSYELFLKGLDEIFKDDFRKAATRFFEITRQMLEEDKPDIIGHLDKIKIYNKIGNFFNENEKWYQDQVELTIDTIKRMGGIVEINTRGYYKYQQPDLYPGFWIIEKLAKKGIPLMINSDAHTPAEIIGGLAYAALKLKSLAINEVYALFNNKWKSYRFDKDGIWFN